MKAPNKYLINALIEWIVDSEMTPQILVNANVEGVQVPDQAIVNGQCHLNISATATRNFHLDDNGLSFESRFQGKVEKVFLPLASILLVYSKENGAAIPLPLMEVEEDNTPPPPPPKGKPKLSIV